MKNYPTAHINATPEDFAKTVIMPGDPLRSKMIAETFLENPKLVNNVRGIQGYTGFYKDTRVSVMASGMGVPSMAIYSYELFNFFGVENIIRVGTAGALMGDVNLRDIVIADGIVTDSNYVNQDKKLKQEDIIADRILLGKAKEKAENLGHNCRVGKVFTTDSFYGDTSDAKDCLAVEMETAALYYNAIKSGKRALTICTIADSLVTGEKLPAEQRQNSFTQMIELALEITKELEN